MSTCEPCKNCHDASTFDAGEYAKTYWPRLSQRKLNPPEETPKEYLQQLLDEYCQQLQRFAPHHLIENEQIDRAFGKEPGFTTSCCLQNTQRALFGQKLNPADHECTSWIVTPDIAENNNMILHKNRDAKNSKELVLLQLAVPGKNKWIGIGNYGTFDVNMALNEKGLAVAMNSGDETDSYNLTGPTTPQLARILLEECNNAEDAVKHLEEMVQAKAYLHGDKGSIWFIADAKNAFIIEHDATHFSAHPVSHGLGLRANAWNNPDIVPFSNKTVQQRILNNSREHTVHQVLIEDGYLANGSVTLNDVFKASRARLHAGEARPPCAGSTNSAASFVIDKEYPETLSLAWIACGPPRHTVFLPIPVVVRQLPDQLLNGSFSDAIFVRAEKIGLDQPLDDYQKLEAQFKSIMDDALAQARNELKNNADKSRATDILNDAFSNVWSIISSTTFPG